ncbi:hypothetical protein K439DRAFT_264507 [Ramaria rubella]|nr:hypothetical protein K439DRAFT_264507 [Ramaria rubella]
MLLAVTRLNTKAFSRAPSSLRGLATHLLERLSISELKNEAKRHGLSPSGSKATLITRIKHVENTQNSPTPSRRDSSTASKTPASSSGVTSNLNIKLPDLSASPEVPGPQIPFLPDFWDSSRIRGANGNHHDVEAPTHMPKVLILTSASTQHAGGPVYDTVELADDHIEQAPKAASKQGLWTDITTDLGLPPLSDIAATLTKAPPATTYEQQYNDQSKSGYLDVDETRGVWVLLSIFGGSWLAGGIFGPKEPRNNKNKNTTDIE